VELEGKHEQKHAEDERVSAEPPSQHHGPDHRRSARTSLSASQRAGSYSRIFVPDALVAMIASLEIRLPGG
jgi:hypothetical protein